MYYLMKDDEQVMEINECECIIINKALLPKELEGLRIKKERVLTFEMDKTYDIILVFDYLKMLLPNDKKKEHDFYKILNILKSNTLYNKDGYYIYYQEPIISLVEIMNLI